MRVYFIELTVPWEELVAEAYERKKLRYVELGAEAEQRGWKVRICPVEVGCRGFVAKSVVSSLRELSISGQSVRKRVACGCGRKDGCCCVRSSDGWH